MPYTPLHIGPGILIGLPLKDKVDLPVLILVNIVIDIEPLLIGLYWPWYYAHAYYHTFLVGSLLGVMSGLIAYPGRGALGRLMKMLHLPYSPDLKKMILSGVLGVWLHIFVDSLAEPSIRPFFPAKFNPYYGLISLSITRLICSLSFIPAVLLYVYYCRRYKRSDARENK